MQVKKDEIVQAIKDSAVEEFLANGFEKASLRKIVKNAGTTLGNFYNYYENKEALFGSLVEQAYQGMIYLIGNHQQWERKDELWDIKDVEIWRKELRKLIEPIIPNITTSFVILIEGSKGTKYEHAKRDLIEMMESHFMEHIHQFNPSYENLELARVLAEQLVFGIVLIVKNNSDDTIRKRLIIEEVLFFAIGVMGILKVL